MDFSKASVDVVFAEILPGLFGAQVGWGHDMKFLLDRANLYPIGPKISTIRQTGSVYVCTCTRYHRKEK